MPDVRAEEKKDIMTIGIYAGGVLLAILLVFCCVLCIEKEVDKIQALVQTQRDNFVQSQIRDGLEPNNSESLLKQATWHFCRSLLDTLNTVY